MNEEFPVGAGHQPASITSLPFVHTARRYYRSNGPVRSSDLADEFAGRAVVFRVGRFRIGRFVAVVGALSDGPEKTTEPDRLEEVKVVTRFP